MTDDQQPTGTLRQPDEIRDEQGERADGRPTGPEREDGLRPGTAHPAAPTEAPEEKGATPSTEHAPGSDL
jgi:hypothetical protein